MVQLIERKHGNVLEENGKQVLSMVVAGVDGRSKLITLLEYWRVTWHVSPAATCIDCNDVFASAAEHDRRIFGT
jgi:hypothetical protein